MVNKATDAFRRFGKTFGSFSPGQKTVAIFAVLAIVVGGFLFSSWVTKPTYSPLFSNLAAADAAAIVEKLTAENTPYQLAAGGQTIMVPQDKVYDLRLAMSGAGLPAQQDGGYSLLDKQGVTTSEFQQQVTYQRAMEGELAKTVKSIDGVQAAVVHLAMPEKSVFADEEKKPTAAVLVELGPGKKLAPQQVQSIVNLTSSSISGLAPEDVTVADSTGALLSTAGAVGGGAGVADARTQATHEYEDRLAASIQSMLDQVVGPGHSVAKVTSQLDFDQTQTKTEKFTSDPKTKALKESATNETYNGTGGGGAGVLGPDNIQVPAGTAAGNGTYDKKSSATENAVDKVTEVRNAAPGAVVRQSVSVLLDAKTSASLPAGEVQKLVSGAAGINTARGDQVYVSQMPFDGTAATTAQKDLAAAKADEQRAQYMSIGKTAGLGLLVALLVFFAWRQSKKTRRSDVSYAELERLDDTELAELEGFRARELAAANRTALEGGARGPADPDPSAHKRDEISAMVDRQPEEVAQLLRGWLADRRS
ncbi:MAG TPA: flagellar basal-body MS-ring/collar protein FliF [Mycobacteriales bacterium]|jgi:flagellar M-ring protein FliF|nr:flagellar basal-body MS-ring/collar protein FliF [Mycobacteriales bacterium]